VPSPPWRGIGAGAAETTFGFVDVASDGGEEAEQPVDEAPAGNGAVDKCDSVPVQRGVSSAHV
jgi:hypothetical protein